MTNKTMPEHVYAGRVFGSIRFETMPHKLQGISTEYIRADLATGDANEPLTEGQFRWVSVGGERHVARLEEMLNDYGDLELFFCTTDGCSWPKDELDFIGPVISPPDD